MKKILFAIFISLSFVACSGSSSVEPSDGASSCSCKLKKESTCSKKKKSCCAKSGTCSAEPSTCSQGS